MSKIRELSGEEAARLREQVRLRFLRGRSNGNGFRPKSFKGAYEDLRDDIIRKEPSAEWPVSVTRLRKLFYYTDPAVCPQEQLKKPSFGRDFIEALERYVADEYPKPGALVMPSKSRARMWRMGWLLLLLPFGGVAAWLFQPMPPPKSWREDFNNVSVDSLRAQGFEWLDFDPAWWSRQARDSFLTLHTLRGDYWVKPHEKREIKNMLYKKLRGNCFSVIAKIDDFDPQHNCQQFDIFLFDERLSKETHLRVGFSYWSGSEQDPGVQHTTTDYQQSGHVTQLGYFHLRKPANEGPSIKTCWLKLHYENGEMSVYQKLNYEWNMWGQCTRPFKLNFKPAFVGIAAFQGWTNDDHSPRSATPIPAFIDFLEVESCDK